MPQSRASTCMVTVFSVLTCYILRPPCCIHFTRVFALLIATDPATAVAMLLIDAVFRRTHMLVVGTGADQKLHFQTMAMEPQIQSSSHPT